MNRKKVKSGAGIGIGYVSVMMIFAVICLTVLAVLSLEASGSGQVLNLKSAEFTADYYAADSKAKEMLMLLDGAAYEAHASGFFDEAFAEAELPEAVVISSVPEGFSAVYIVPVNERLNLNVSVLFFSDTAAHSGRRYEITEWRTAGVSDGESSSPIHVWDGGALP